MTTSARMPAMYEELSVSARSFAPVVIRPLESASRTETTTTPEGAPARMTRAAAS